jgi:glycosyltransferase involved in cell wall biosynthesis
MKICFVTKYPPIQGGVSARCYWLARGLAERGHTVVVVTNAQEVESEYRIRLTAEDAAWYEPQFTDAGGTVIVRSTRPAPESQRYIPYANPFVTKLATLAQQSIVEHGCSAIFAYYLEPYGVAAHLASRWSGTPYVIQHAGSDMGRLMKDPELQGAYREVLAGAAYVVSRLKEPLAALGVEPDRIWTPPHFPIPDVFAPTAPAADLVELAKDAVPIGGAPVRSFDPALPTIGIYGKVGAVKGSFDLLNAVKALADSGRRFNLVAVTQGRDLAPFIAQVRDLAIEDRTTVLPFMPHWRIPGFLRACTAVCFLEREFPIGFHAPTVPREVLATGTCLILSREILAKQSFRSAVVDGEHLLSVDPTDRAALVARLEGVIDAPSHARRIGDAGRRLFVEHVQTSDWRAVIDTFEERLSALPRPAEARRRAASSAARRTADLADRLPYSRAALGDQWPTLVEEYCGPARAVAAEHEDAVGCADFLREADLPGAPPWLGDLLRYESAHNRAYVESSRLTARVADGTAAGRHRRSRPGDLRVEDTAFFALAPRVDEHLHVERFGFDMTDVCAALHRSDADAPIRHTPTTIVFKPEPNFVTQELVINDDVRRLLDLCDGQRTVGEIAGAFASAGAGDEAAVRHHVALALRQLASKGLVAFLRLPAESTQGQPAAVCEA